jgi:hypothetical protein
MVTMKHTKVMKRVKRMIFHFVLFASFLVKWLQHSFGVALIVLYPS